MATIVDFSARRVERKLMKTGNIEWDDFLAGDSDVIIEHLLYRASVNPAVKRRLVHAELMDKLLLSNEVLVNG